VTAALEGKSADQIVTKLKRDWPPAIKANYMVWPAAQLVNFTFVPQVRCVFCFCNFLFVLTLDAESGRLVCIRHRPGVEHVAVLDELKKRLKKSKSVVGRAPVECSLRGQCRPARLADVA
jgi:hypothetical protein